ncbi:MAG: hypothetical protein AAGA58_10185 [Verrucomicrobiota bacterium]
MKFFDLSIVRQSSGLILGLVVGIFGAIMFQQSVAPDKETVAGELEQVQHKLRKAEREIAALRADGKSTKSRRTVSDGIRSIAERIRAGEEISLDDVFWKMKPWMRDMAPLFDRMRMVEQEDNFDRIAGELARKYDLSKEDREALQNWLLAKSEKNSRKFNEVIFSETSGFVDFMKVSNFDAEDVHGLDDFMESRLEGEALDEFKADRLDERIKSVEAEADRRLERLNEAVGLEDDQIDDMFAVLARGSSDYRDGMEIGVEGADTGRIEGAGRDNAIRGILRGNQIRKYERYQNERRWEAEQEMRRVGLALPRDWQLLDDDAF